MTKTTLYRGCEGSICTCPAVSNYGLDIGKTGGSVSRVLSEVVGYVNWVEVTRVLQTRVLVNI